MEEREGAKEQAAYIEQIDNPDVGELYSMMLAQAVFRREHGKI